MYMSLRRVKIRWVLILAFFALYVDGEHTAYWQCSIIWLVLPSGCNIEATKLEQNQSAPTAQAAYSFLNQKLHTLEKLHMVRYF